MKLVIEKIRINNFKGILQKELEFSSGKNIIEGENGIGKTTVLDAIAWVLFGKNFADEKLFKIKPIIDGEEKSDLTTSVEIVINNKSIERIWDNKNTLIKVDGVKFGSREFSDYLRNTFSITDEEFKALSNIEYIPKLHWKDLRSLIMGLVGEISNEDVFELGDFSLIKEKINSVGIEKTIESIKDSKFHVSNEIKKILGNIDQKTKDIEYLVVDENEQKQLEIERTSLKQKIDKYNSIKEEIALQEQEKEKLERMKIELNNTNAIISRLIEDKSQYQDAYNNSAIDVKIEKENRIKELQNNISLKEKAINEFNLELTTLALDRKELKEKYENEVNKEVKIENNLCSACGQPLPQEKIEEVLKSLKEESVNKANQYAQVAQSKKQRIDNLSYLIQKYKEEIESINNEILEVKNQQIVVDKESDTQILMKKRIEEVNSEISNRENDKLSLEENIKTLETKILCHREINDVQDINALQADLEEITNKLAISQTLKIFEEQLKELENTHNALLNEKTMLTDMEQQVVNFNNTKAEMLRKKVKNYFKIADFITQETTKDGKLVETFKIAINGIEYSSLNNGHKILVSLDLIEGIQNLKDKHLPILIDGLGELTRLPEINTTQIIGCRAKFQVNKKMELSNN